VCVFAREFPGVSTSVRMRRAVGITLKCDGGNGDYGSRSQPPFKLVILRLAFGQSKPPAVVVDDDLYVVGVVEGGRATVERCVVEAPFRRSELPDELVKVTPVFFVAGTAALRREVKLVPPFEFGLRRQRHLVRFRAADQVAAHRDERLAALGP